MSTITLFGEQYESDNLPEQIELSCGCIYTQIDTKFGFSYSHSTICTTHKYPFDIDYARNSKIDEMNKFISKTIYDSYSREKQFNILAGLDGYTESTKNDMFDFINAVLEKQEILKSNINALPTIEDILDFDIVTEYNNLP